MEEPLTRLYRLRPSDRRNRRDEEHLALLLAYTLSPASNCIDIGAHTGHILRQMVRLAPEGRHIAYEPLPDLAAGLRSAYPDVTVRQAALSDAAGQVSFVHVVSQPGYSGLRERDYPGEETVQRLTVEAVRLDDDLPADHVPDLIKIDVEGGEGLVMAGGMDTIRKHKPIVFFEHGAGSSDHYGTTSSDIHRMLVEDAGLRIFDVDGGGPYSRMEFEALFDQPIWNFVAHA